MTSNHYVATVTATVGAVTSNDGYLSIDVHEPAELGGPGESTNPEQLMAAALASCLVESLRIAIDSTAGSLDHLAVEGKVTLTDSDQAGYDSTFLLSASIPGVADAESVLSQAVSICPFLKNVAHVEVILV